MANETIEILRHPGTLFPRGAFDENADYKFLNFVESGGNGYVCLQPCTGIPVTNTAYWFKFVFKGEKGDAFTYADLTAEQKAELVRDATAAAQAAASSAQSAADDAAAVLQKFNTIKAAIDAIDPTSTEGSIQTLAAKQGLLEAGLNALGLKLDSRTQTETTTDLTSQVVWNKYIKVNYSVGTTISTDPTTNATYCYLLLEVTEGQKFRVKGQGGDGPRLWAFLDSEYKLLSVAASNTQTTDYIELTASEDGYLIYNAAKSSSLYPKSILKVEIQTVKDEISGIKTRVTSCEGTLSTHTQKIDALESSTVSKIDDDKVYNLNVADKVAMKKVLSVAADLQYPLFDYLGKGLCTIKVTSATENAQAAIKIWAKNKATDNAINLYNSTTLVNLPIEIDNPRPDLELIDVKLTTYSTSPQDILTIEIAKDNPFLAVVENAEKINSINQNDGSYNEAEQSNSVTKYINADGNALFFPYVGKRPCKFVISSPNVSSCRFNLQVKNEDTGNTFMIYNTDYAVSLPVEVVNPRPDLPLTNVKLHLYSAASDGVSGDYTITMTNQSSYDRLCNLIQGRDIIYRGKVTASQGSTIDISIPSVQAFKVYSLLIMPTTIDNDSMMAVGILTSTNGHKNVHNVSCSTDVMNIPIFSNAAFNGIYVYFGGQYAAGDVEIALICEDMQDYPLHKNKPFCQFGLGRNFKYVTPTQSAYSGTGGQGIAYFYSLFDGLVAAYPNYVSKVDCDAKAVAAGLTIPTELANLPIYMYKFIPSYTPNATGYDTTASNITRKKVMVVGGTHPEYISIFDLYHTMRIICEDWQNDDNIDALRWEAEYYIIPVSGPYGVQNGSRTNYNHVDLNRNAPASDWLKTTPNTNTWSGNEPSSEYETKVLELIFNEVKPDIFIDHHNSNSGDGKNLMYITSKFLKGVDIGAAHISEMSRRWKKRCSGVFPSDDILYGFAQLTAETGSRGVWACEKGALGFTYESNNALCYTEGEYTPSTPQTNTSMVVTLATDGFINFLMRVLASL